MSWIEWPPGCDPNKHLPSRKGRLNDSDPRIASSSWLAVGGINTIRKALNIPIPKKHTRESVEADIREHFAKTGKRPSQLDLRSQEQWLYRRRLSLSKLCDELGLPRSRVTDRTRESIEAEVREFFTKTGKRPCRHDLECPGHWLKKRGSSLAKLCDELGLPGGRVLNRTRESVEAEVREHFAKTGRRPTEYDLPNLNAWLRGRGSSLAKLCDELGLPVGKVFNRTRESVEAEIREFFTKTGKCPTQYDLPKLQGWLRARGSSLPKLCDELGLPKAPRGRHAKPRTPKEIQP